jgi:hypothetical protein
MRSTTKIAHCVTSCFDLARIELLSIVLMLCCAGKCFGQAEVAPCFAFLSKGDVQVECQGRQGVLTNANNIRAFAVSAETLSLLYTTDSIIDQRSNVSTVRSEATIVDLRTFTTKMVKEAVGAVATCGGLYIANGETALAIATDLFGGIKLPVTPFVRFRCSSDRSTIIGVVSRSDSDLYRRSGTGTERLLPGDRFDSRAFNMSPDGSQIVFRDKKDRLCVMALAGNIRCIEQQGSLVDVPSVINSGDVLVAVGTERECVYRSPFNFHPIERSRSTEGDQDECLGIALWRSSSTSLQLVAPIGRSPQWITPVLAERLLAWSAELSKGPPRRQ